METKHCNNSVTTIELCEAMLKLIREAIPQAEMPKAKDECSFSVKVRFVKPNFEKSDEIRIFKVYVNPKAEKVSTHELNPIRIYARSAKCGRVEFRNDFNHTYNLSAYLLNKLDDAHVLNQVISKIITDDFAMVDEIITATLFDAYPVTNECITHEVANHLDDIQLTWKRVSPNVSKAMKENEQERREQ